MKLPLFLFGLTALVAYLVAALANITRNIACLFNQRGLHDKPGDYVGVPVVYPDNPDTGTDSTPPPPSQR